MASLSWVATHWDEAWGFLSGVTDFSWYEAGQDAPVLYALGVGNPGLTAFVLTENQAAEFALSQALPHQQSLVPAEITVGSIFGHDYLWAGAWLEPTFRSYNLNENGLVEGGIHPDGVSLHGLVHVELDGTFGWAGYFNSGGIARVELGPDGSIIAVQDVVGAAEEDVAVLALSDGFVLTASLASPALTSWQIGPGGSLVASDSFGVADGLGIATPTALESVSLDGEEFVILGAAGSSSLSVLSLGSNGSLELRDHVIDTLETRFGGVQALNVVKADDRVFVIAGGADDGISLFQLLAGGRLLHLDSVADGLDTTLRNIGAVSAIVVGNEIQVFAGGEETGITQFRLSLNSIGETVAADALGVGTSRADILRSIGEAVVLQGRGGDDVLIDGAGADRLIGGGGADIFVISSDGVTDTIEDFNVAEDRLDLTGYNFLRSIVQLSFVERTDGVEIWFGDEQLILLSEDGAPIDPDGFTSASFLSLNRVLIPNVPPPPTGIDAVGSSGSDKLIGTEYVDVLRGLGGRDKLLGRGEDDRLIGGGGKDKLIGGAGDDVLIGRGGKDKLIGGGGKDELIGGAGEDQFYFRQGDGRDNIIDFEDNMDRLYLDPNLWEGDMNVQQVLDEFGREKENLVILDFGAGDKILFKGLDGLTTLTDGIDFL